MNRLSSAQSIVARSISYLASAESSLSPSFFIALMKSSTHGPPRKINHEETMNPKKENKNFRVLHFFVVDFHFCDASCGLFARCATIPFVDGLRIFYTFST